MSIEIAIIEPENTFKVQLNRVKAAIAMSPGGNQVAAIQSVLNTYALELRIAARKAVERKTAELQLVIENELAD